MGREESKEQAKEAQRAKELEAHAKKTARKDKEWSKGTDQRGEAKSAEQAAKDAEKARIRNQALAKAQEEAEGGPSKPPTQAKLGFKKCKDCSTKHDPKKGCPL